MRERKNRCSSLGFSYSRERVCAFSLRLRVIQPSEFVETRRKVVLRDKGNTWAPILRSFNKLREVGVSSYLKLHFV